MSDGEFQPLSGPNLHGVIRFGPSQEVFLHGGSLPPVTAANRMAHVITATDGASIDVLGSGFYIFPGLMLTAHHVIADHLSEIRAGQYALYVVALISQDETPQYVPLRVTNISTGASQRDHDLALLTTAVPTEVRLGCLPLSFARPDADRSILALGYPEARGSGDGRALTVGTLQATQGTLHEIHAPFRDRGMLSFPVLQSDYPSPHGMSGGPVILENGFVCAVVSSSYDTDGPPLSYGALLAPGLNLSTGPDENGERSTLYQLCEEGFVRSDGSHRLYGP